MKILWLKTGPLHPLDTGGKIRTYNMLRALGAEHEVTYLSLAPAGTSEEILASGRDYARHCEWVTYKDVPKGSVGFAFQLLCNLVYGGAPPLAVSRYTHLTLEQKLIELAVPEKHDLLVCDFLAPADNVLNVSHAIKIPAVLFQHNVESVIWERLAENAADPIRGFVLRNQRDRMLEFEQAASRAFDGVITVSPEDTDTFKKKFRLDNVLGDVPTGVDVPHFQEVPRDAAPSGLTFLGSMDWHANVDGVRWFAESAYPQILAAKPDVTLTIVGRRPPASVTALAEAEPSITVTGTVDDVRPYLAKGAVLVVPLRIGGGTRIKIFEAIAAGIPVVSTRIGAEGLPLIHDEHVLLADSPAELAESAIALLNDPARAQRLADNARTLVQTQFTWQAVANAFTQHCQTAITRHQAES